MKRCILLVALCEQVIPIQMLKICVIFEVTKDVLLKSHVVRYMTLLTSGQAVPEVSKEHSASIFTVK